MTGEAWNEIMNELLVEKGCTRHPSYEQLVAARAVSGDPTLTIGCSPGKPMVYIFFCTFLVVSTYLTLNLFIAVLLDGFETQMRTDEASFTQEQFKIMRDEWQKYDWDADYFISEADFLKFLVSVLEPLGAINATLVHFKEDKAELMKIAKSLQLKDYDGMVYFREVAQALAKLVFVRKTKKPLDELDGVPEIDLYTAEKSTKAMKFIDTATKFTFEERVAAKLIQSIIRGRKARTAVRQKKQASEASLLAS